MTNKSLVHCTHYFLSWSDKITNGVLLPKLFWASVRNFFEIRGSSPENLKFLRSLESERLEQFLKQSASLRYSRRSHRSNTPEKSKLKLEKIIGIYNKIQEKFWTARTLKSPWGIRIRITIASQIRSSAAEKRRVTYLGHCWTVSVHLAWKTVQHCSHWLLASRLNGYTGRLS